MRISVLPKSLLGRWSVSLAAACILVCVLVGVLAQVFGLGLPSGSVGIRIFFAAVIISGIGSLVTGLIGIIKSKERSILVFSAEVVGLFTLFFLYMFIAEEQW